MTMLRRSLLAAVTTLAVLVATWPATAQTTLNSTTLSAAVTSNAQVFSLASGTNVSAGDLLVVDREAMLVDAIATAQVTVRRGVEGTAAVAHLSGATVYTGVKSRFYSSTPRGGACTRASERFLPHIDVANGTIYDCIAGEWQRWNTERQLYTKSLTLSGENTVTGRLLVRESFDQPYFIMQDDATAKSVTDAEVNVVIGSPVGVITFREEQTKTTSSWIVADGALDISADTTDNEGVEIVLGWTTTNEGWIVAGTSGLCFTVNVTVADVSGTDQVVIGWRQNEAYDGAAVYTGYSDWSVVGITVNDGSIKSLGEVAGGGTLTDDSDVNLADAGTMTLKSCISAAGVPTAFYGTGSGGVASTAITMTNSGTAKTAGVQMNPFISYLAAGTDGADVTINWLELSALPGTR